MDSLPLNRLFGRDLFNDPDDLNAIDRALRAIGVLPGIGLQAAEVHTGPGTATAELLQGRL